MSVFYKSYAQAVSNQHKQCGFYVFIMAVLFVINMQWISLL